MGERGEILMRIIVAIITGIIISLWGYVVYVVATMHWIITFVTGKRLKAFADFCETWNTQKYCFTRYLLLLSNERPFPFSDVNKNLSEFK